MGSNECEFLCLGSCLGGGDGVFRPDVTSVKGKKSRLITCSFIVPKQESYGNWFFLVWSGMGDDALLSKRNSFELIRFFCGEKVEES